LSAKRNAPGVATEGVPKVIAATVTSVTEADLDPWWADGAQRALGLLAESGRIFAADDLRDDPYSVPEPSHPNQWGSLFRAAHRVELIRPVGFTTSRTASRHGGVTRLWRGGAAR